MISINTNLSSLITQRNLKNSTSGLNVALERMSTGYKINHAKDNAANYSIAQRLTTKLSSLDVVAENISMGSDMLQTASSNAELISEHLSRIRDLVEQASNGTYDENSIRAIKSEVQARMEEIQRIKGNSEYNGIDLFGQVQTSFVASDFINDINRLTEAPDGFTAVTKADELVLALKNNENICLMNDISMAGRNYNTDYHGITNYSGTVDGNGYSIYVNQFEECMGGLLSSTAAAGKTVIKNLKIELDSLEHAVGGGIICDLYGDVTINNCIVIGSVDSYVEFGGICENNNGNLTVNDTYVSVEELSSVSIDALVYYNNGNVNLSNFYYNNELFTTSQSGAIGLSTSELNALSKGNIISTRGKSSSSIYLQVGLEDTLNSKITIEISLDLSGLDALASADVSSASTLDIVDGILNNLSAYQTSLGAGMNRLESAWESVEIMNSNMTSSLSTIRDADMAEESSEYIKMQILQEASATLLATANQTPAIALQLIRN